MSPLRFPLCVSLAGSFGLTAQEDRHECNNNGIGDEPQPVCSRSFAAANGVAPSVTRNRAAEEVPGELEVHEDDDEDCDGVDFSSPLATAKGTFLILADESPYQECPLCVSQQCADLPIYVP